MKTTIDIADGLLEEAKAEARREGVTLRALLEDGLRRVLRDRRGRGKRFRLRDASVAGRGLAPALHGAGFDAVRALIYEGRGG